MDTEIDIPVGKTCLYTCGERAIESARETDRIFEDVEAETLSGSQGKQLIEKFHAVHNGIRTVALNMSVVVRTKFFDQVFEFAVQQNIKQFVIVAAGMDTRFFRLNAENKTNITVWELDFPQVFEYKRQRLSMKTLPDNYHLVGVDFTQDNWSEELLKSGYDAKVRSLWIMEGLLMYLSDSVIEDLLTKINTLTSDQTILTGDWMNRSYMQSAITQKFRAVFESFGSPFINGRDHDETIALFQKYAGFKLQLHALGDTLSDFTKRFPRNQKLVANQFSITKNDYQHVPRHFLFIGEKCNENQPLSDWINNFSDVYRKDPDVSGKDVTRLVWDTDSKESIINGLREFVMNELGISAAECGPIPNSTNIFDYGVDSLVISQLYDMLASKYPDSKSLLCEKLWLCETLDQLSDLVLQCK